MGKIGPFIWTAIIILAVIYAYNYFSDDGITKLGRNASGGPGKEGTAK